MSIADPLPEGTDQIIDGAGVGSDDDDTIAEETMFTPDENPDEVPGVEPELSATATPHDAPPSDGGEATGGGSTTGAGFGTSALFERFDSLKSEGYDRAREFAQTGLDRAGSAIDDVVRMINEAADQIDDKVGAQYGGYARKTAESIGGFSDLIKGKDVDVLFADARDLVRKSPAVAIGTAAALGFVIARLARAGLPETPPAPNSNSAA